jgi:hypothetical protein
MLVVDTLVGGVQGLLFGAVVVLVLLSGLWFSWKSDWYVALDNNSVEIRSILLKRISLTKIVSVDTPTSHRVVLKLQGLVWSRIGPFPIPQDRMVLLMGDPRAFVAEVRSRIGSAPQTAA